MHVFSKIVESGQIMCDLSITDDYVNEAAVQYKEVNYHAPKLASYHNKIRYAPGLFIQETQIHTEKAITDDFLTSGQHIRFFFYLKGHSQVKRGAGNTNYGHAPGMLQRNYLDENGGGSLIHIPANDDMEYVVIKMSKDFYMQLLKEECWIDTDAFHQYILAGPPKNRPNETFYLDLKTLQILQDLLHSEHPEQYQYHFLRLKLRELLFHIRQLTELGPAQRKNSQTDNEVLEKIRAQLIMHLDNPPSASELAKQYMLNEKTLIRDFKTVYGCTIYAFVIEARMRKAQELLRENYNVGELAMLLGYQSVSHFIKVFKNYHGCTPKEALNRFQAIKP